MGLTRNPKEQIYELLIQTGFDAQHQAGFFKLYFIVRLTAFRRPHRRSGYRCFLREQNRSHPLPEG